MMAASEYSKNIFQIKIMNPFGKNIKMNVCTDDDVQQVLETLTPYVPKELSHLRLVKNRHGFHTLEDREMTLIEHGICDGDTLVVLPLKTTGDTEESEESQDDCDFDFDDPVGDIKMNRLIDEWECTRNRSKLHIQTLPLPQATK
eukprot:CFRG6599T1